MAFRLNDIVVGGELNATRHYSVHGYLQLRDQERPLLLQLTGNPCPDLIGKRIRFEVREPPSLAATPTATADFDDSSLAWQQIGPTGTITADRRVKVADCPVEEMYQRAKLGEPPPFEWKPCLYIEWFSQNGRMVVELVDPIIELVDDDQEDDEELDPGDDVLLDADAVEWDPLDDADGPGGDLPISAIDSGDAPAEAMSDIPFGDDWDDAEDEDPYGLFPDNMQAQFDTDSYQVDRAIESDDKPDAIRELELMDDLIEQGEGDIIGTIFDSPLKLPRPDDLSDDEVEGALKSVLTQMALFGIALDVCEHFSPRDAYRLLVDEICKEQRAYPQLRSTQWVQHFMTSEFCPKCEEELDREFEEMERELGEIGDDYTPGDDPARDDDVPF